MKNLKKIRSRSVRISSIWLCIIVIIGCKEGSQYSCDLQVFNDSTGERPLIFIREKLSGCEYEFEGFFSLRDGELLAHGLLIAKDHAFYLDAKQLGDQPIRFFDFAKEQMAQYVISIDGPNRASYFVVTKEDVVSHSAYGQVHVFRIRDGFVFRNFGSRFDVPMDIVFFVSPTSGIVGSYLSLLHANKEEIANVSGDILMQLIDYSHAEFVVIE